MLDRAGRLLYGSNHKGALARALGIRKSTIERWCRNGDPLPEGVLRDLYALLTERDRESAAVKHDLMHELYPEETTP